MRAGVRVGLGHYHISGMATCGKTTYNVRVYCRGDKVNKHGGENPVFEAKRDGELKKRANSKA